MRLWHLILAIVVLAFAMTVARDPAGRVAMIVFGTGLGAVFLGTTSVLALFQSVGAIGEARGPGGHAEAIAATALVLTVATAGISGWLFLGMWLVQAAVD